MQVLGHEQLGPQLPQQYTAPAAVVVVVDDAVLQLQTELTQIQPFEQQQLQLPPLLQLIVVGSCSDYVYRSTLSFADGVFAASPRPRLLRHLPSLFLLLRLLLHPHHPHPPQPPHPPIILYFHHQNKQL